MFRPGGDYRLYIGKPFRPNGPGLVWSVDSSASSVASPSTRCCPLPGGSWWPHALPAQLQGLQVIARSITRSGSMLDRTSSLAFLYLGCLAYTLGYTSALVDSQPLSSRHLPAVSVLGSWLAFLGLVSPRDCVLARNVFPTYGSIFGTGPAVVFVTVEDRGCTGTLDAVLHCSLCPCSTTLLYLIVQ